MQVVAVDQATKDAVEPDASAVVGRSVEVFDDDQVGVLDAELGQKIFHPVELIW